MARTPKAKPAPEPEETDEGGAVRGPGEMHELFSDWLKEETGVTVSPEAIFLVTSKRTAFRKSEEYLAYAEKLDEEREARAKEKEERKAARESAADDEPEEKPAPRRGRAKKAAETADTAEDKVTPIRGRRGRAKATADTADEAQAETAPAAKPSRRRRSTPAGF